MCHLETESLDRSSSPFFSSEPGPVSREADSSPPFAELISLRLARREKIARYVNHMVAMPTQVNLSAVELVEQVTPFRGLLPILKSRLTAHKTTT